MFRAYAHFIDSYLVPNYAVMCVLYLIHAINLEGQLSKMLLCLHWLINWPQPRMKMWHFTRLLC